MRKTKLFSYLLYSLIQSMVHGLIIYFVIYRLIAKEDMLITFFLNILYIILGLFLADKGRKFGLSKKNEIIEMYKGMGKITKTIFDFSQVSFRPSMYVFYIIVLIFSNLSLHERNLIPFNLEDFFSSIEYGILILMAYDNLKALLINEWQWFKENVAPE
ncbi:MAG: hypothetical protein FWD09_09625 [Lentimicrobiaceae bacterium]|nr:hypothetical protein [Lentimicrobiaceae bacterium]